MYTAVPSEDSDDELLDATDINSHTQKHCCDLHVQVSSYPSVTVTVTSYLTCTSAERLLLVNILWCFHGLGVYCSFSSGWVHCINITEQ